MDEDIIESGRQEVNNGIGKLKMGQKDKASTHFMKAMDYFDSIDDKMKRRDELGVFASLLVRMGFGDLAVMSGGDAIELDRALGEKKKLVEDLLTLGNAHDTLGNPDKAIENNQEALRICLDNGYFADAASANTNLAGIIANKGRMDEAISMLRKSLEYLKKEPFPESEKNTRLMLIQALGIQKQGPEEIIENVKIVFRNHFNELRRDQLGAIMPHLTNAVQQYLEKHPEIDPDSWKTDNLPWIYNRRR